jgi:hypothetical protein
MPQERRGGVDAARSACRFSSTFFNDVESTGFGAMSDSLKRAKVESGVSILTDSAGFLQRRALGDRVRERVVVEPGARSAI